jgi:glycosyltransferase involved in cell wall biosynthesis
VKQGFIIPVYRHGKTACLITQQLAAFGLPVILVDDGNDTLTQKELADCAEKTSGVILTRLEKNSGKGVAVIKGFQKAAEIGLTHVLQIDADGQHDIGRVIFFLEESAKYPDRIICGYPEFDQSAPRSRVTGRKISTFWAAVVTLSMELKDLLCGFRVYPVAASLRITKKISIDKRMGFDPEILVRLYWNNVLPVFHPIKVIYPQDGISNFNIVRDNLRISWMFTRLFAGMLFRLPLLIAQKIKRRKKK